MKKIIFSEEQLKDIIYKYQIKKYSLRKLGELYNVSKTVISRILKENNIPTNLDRHKYKADYRKFEIIDSNEKAYWLGFLAADGCNYWRETNASIIINIHQKDIEHLEKFKNFMNTNANIINYVQNSGYSNNTPMCKIVLNSKDMSQDLSNKGIIPNKSLILQPPQIQKDFYFPFILGYFDGDGSIFKNKSTNTYGISFIGTKEMLEWIKIVLEIDAKIEHRNNNNLNNYYIRCGGLNKPYNILKKLYDSCNIHLDRKYNIYKTLETVVLSRNTK